MSTNSTTELEHTPAPEAENSVWWESQVANVASQELQNNTAQTTAALDASLQEVSQLTSDSSSTNTSETLAPEQTQDTPAVSEHAASQTTPSQWEIIDNIEDKDDASSEEETEEKTSWWKKVKKTSKTAIKWTKKVARKTGGFLSKVNTWVGNTLIATWIKTEYPWRHYPKVLKNKSKQIARQLTSALDPNRSTHIEKVGLSKNKQYEIYKFISPSKWTIARIEDPVNKFFEDKSSSVVVADESGKVFGGNDFLPEWWVVYFLQKVA